MEFLSPAWFSALAAIVVIDLVLAGDNAIVIALACRNLPQRLRMRGILWGTAGAIGIRVALIVFAITLLTVPYLKLVGGVLLVWVGVKLVAPDDEDQHGNIEGGATLMSAIKTIIVADLVMSFDNVIAIAGAAQQAEPEHQTSLVILGLLISIPLIVWGSTLVLKLLERFPLLITLGGALLGWIAGGMVVTDVATVEAIGEPSAALRYAASAAGAVLVVLIGKVLTARRRAAA
ncbi:MAG: TerC family protein [Burkholderiaceae bacterium]|nr:TerC family protein [Burkholderiaceae bacterium]